MVYSLLPVEQMQKNRIGQDDDPNIHEVESTALVLFLIILDLIVHGGKNSFS